MIDSIIKSMGPDMISKFVGQFGLSEEQASKALETTQASLTETAGKEVASGNFDGLLDLVNKGSAASNSSAFQNMAGNLASDFITKLGISEGVAKQITNFVLPLVLDKIAAKTGGNAGKGDLMKIIGGSAGDILKGKAGDMLGGLGNLFK